MSIRVKGGAALLAAAGAGILSRKVFERSRLSEAQQDISGQVALVTGSSKGLGFLLAREFAREGCRVVICARGEQALEKARAELEREGGEVLAVQCDVSDRSQVERMIAEVTNRFGGVDILVNNAGIITIGPVQYMAREDFEQSMNIMFWGTYNTTMAVLPRMLARRQGRVVNVTSVGAKVSVPHLLPYNCAKFAAIAFSEGLRSELVRYGVKVTTIAPGLMRTGSYMNVVLKGRHKQEFNWFALGSTVPLITMDPEDAAREIVEAARRGEAERILSLPANVLARCHGVLPGTIVNVLGLVNRLLPGTKGGSSEGVKPRDEPEKYQNPLLETVSRLGGSPARKYQR